MTVVAVKTRKHKNFKISFLNRSQALGWASYWERKPSTIKVKVSKA